MIKYALLVNIQTFVPFIEYMRRLLFDCIGNKGGGDLLANSKIGVW
jgi:hypothetical protein